MLFERRFDVRLAELRLPHGAALRPRNPRLSDNLDRGLRHSRLDLELEIVKGVDRWPRTVYEQAGPPKAIQRSWNALSARPAKLLKRFLVASYGGAT